MSLSKEEISTATREQLEAELKRVLDVKTKLWIGLGVSVFCGVWTVLDAYSQKSKLEDEVSGYKYGRIQPVKAFGSRD